ncbi:MAG: hypothetical protein BGO98_08465 [Myxococcales bacterium 68-20]|nr:hypothetical protein [Myxococcales bacterium]OJY25028.1 MAG: hypothetical protein BGO98_08465 [Myxococcales bacterium 68-20]
MAFRLAPSCLLLGGIFAVAACNAITGASDLEASGSPSDPPADGGLTGDAADNGGNGDGDGGGGNGADDDGGLGDGGDGGLLVVDPISPSLASCGINRLCITSTNAWVPVLSGGFGNCGGEWSTRREFKGTGGGGCGCNCAPTSGSCGDTITSKDGATCGGLPTLHDIPGDGSCSTALPAFALPIAFGSQPASPPTACAGTPMNNLSRPRNTSVCGNPTTTQSDACKDDEVCVAKQFGQPVCVMHEGEVACPSQLPVRTVLGSAVDDQRSCGATCTCEPSPCNDGTLRAYSDATCSTSIRSLDVDGSCTTNGASLSNAASYRYTRSKGCKVKDAPAVLGNQIVTAPMTVCCPLGGGF